MAWHITGMGTYHKKLAYISAIMILKSPIHSANLKYYFRTKKQNTRTYLG